MNGIKHHLIDFVDIKSQYSVSNYCDDAKKVFDMCVEFNDKEITKYYEEWAGHKYSQEKRDLTYILDSLTGSIYNTNRKISDYVLTEGGVINHTFLTTYKDAINADMEEKNKLYFSAMLRLLDLLMYSNDVDKRQMIAYTKKLIEVLNREGYVIDAKIVENYLIEMETGKKMARAVMDEIIKQ